MNGEIPTTKVYEDEFCFAFKDIEPLAPEHFLVIPRQHVTSAAEIDQDVAPVVGHIYTVIAKLAKEMGFTNGFRVVTNCGPDAGQTVPHLHFHVLAGKQLGSFN
jgi:histidine triad (HIT) family protein